MKNKKEIRAMLKKFKLDRKICPICNGYLFGHVDRALPVEILEWVLDD